jgi:hypothetical protein
VSVRPGIALGLLLVLLGAASCRGGSAPPPPAIRSIAVDSDTALALRRRVDGFYLRLASRRFNTLETFADRIMREHFRSPNLFLDYYADLAQAFADAHFERRRPVLIEVLELRFEDPTTAQVRVLYVGQDDRPLRFWEVGFHRADRWHWEDGAWWIRPGKI